MSNAVNRARLAMKSVSTASSVIVFEDIKAGCYAMKRALRQTQRTRSLWEKKSQKTTIQILGQELHLKIQKTVHKEQKTRDIKRKPTEECSLQ